jgi:hypothetical protein
MIPLVAALKARQLLHNLQPSLFDEATLNHRGKLRPGLTIMAEMTRQIVEVAGEFEIIRKREIKFIRERIPNMDTWAEIHTHFAEEDQRIPAFSCYIVEENRPYQDNTLLEFRLADGVDVPDTTGCFGGAAGGVSPGGCILPPIIFPKAPMDTTGVTKMHGAPKGVLDGNSD